MKVIYLNKPYGVLCQFTDTSERVTLANYFHNDEASGCYAAGRLDKDSEGLVVLTDNGTYQHLVSHPDFKAPKVYWAQVEGDIGEREVNLLRKGVTLNDGMTRPAGARVISEPDVWAREPPIRMRKHIPTRWLELTLYEGRNRQVRRMTAAVGFPTLRLIRFAVGDVNLDNVVHGMRLPPGQSAMHHLSEKEFAKLRRYRSSKSDTFKDARRRKHHPMKPSSR